MSIPSVPTTGYADTVIASAVGQAPLFTSVDMEAERFDKIKPASIIKLVEREDQTLIQQHGGIEGIVSALHTHIDRGIRGDERDISRRRQAFGSNMYGDNQLAAKNFYHFVLEALKDPMILILLVSTVLSIGFGIRKLGLKVALYEGVPKLAAIFGAILAYAGSNFWPERQCQRLSVDSSKIQQVDVVRNGHWQRVDIPNIVVGDVVYLKPGDQVPADGLYLDTESSIQVDRLETDGQCTRITVDGQENPFFFSGTNVVLGYARMVVTAVGKNRESQTIKLDGKLVEQLENLTSVMGKAGDAVASLIFLVLLFRLFAGNIHNEEGNQVSIGGKSHIFDALAALVGIVATPAMIAVTSTPRGLLLAVKIALAYSMKKMIGNDVLLKKPSLCNAIGSVTTICANATGSLTMDSKEVTKFWLGLSSIERVPSRLIDQDVQELLRQGIGFNISQSPSNSLSDSSLITEKAIFDWAKEAIDMNPEALQQSYAVVEIDYFNPEKQQSGVLILKKDDKTFHLHRKGAPEVILPMCKKYYETTGLVKYINDNEKVLLEQTIEGMAKDGLRCIAFAHKKTSIREFFTSRQPQLILLGLVGLKSTLRPGVKEAVEEFQHAGVNLKMITGDNMLTARAVASECGILDANKDQPGEIIQGSDFQSYTSEERTDKIDNIRVVARATPSDKFLIVQCLKEKGHVVAVMGRGIGDMQAMREADLGVCLSMKSADIAKAMYGDNQLAAKNFYHFVLEALKDPMILILLVSTVLSIGFGIRKLGLKVALYEGVPKLAAIFGAILAYAGSNFWPERQCRKLSVDSSKIQQVDVVRNGHWQRVDIPNIVVGDVVYLKPGDQVPADGLYLDTESPIQVDRLETDGQSTRITVDGQENPFFFSGTNVVLGYARMVVTAVGKNRESQTIKLDGKLVEQLENLTSVMGKAGDAVASLIFLVLLFRLFAGNIHNEEGNQVSIGGKSHIFDALAALVGIVATPAMIAVTSTPRGLLLAVKIALAYSLIRTSYRLLYLQNHSTIINLNYDRILILISN